MCKFENLNKINISLFNSEFTERHLAYTNKTRTITNEKGMNKLKGEYHGYKLVSAVIFMIVTVKMLYYIHICL